MDGLRGELLPGPALAPEEYRRGSRGDASELVIELLHRLGAAEDVAETPEPAQLVAQLADLGAQLAGLGDAPQDRLQPLDVDRLHQLSGRPQPKRFDGALHARMSGDHHHLRRGTRLEVTDQLDPAPV